MEPEGANISVLPLLLKQLASFLLTSGAPLHTVKFVSGNVQDGFTKLLRVKSGKSLVMRRISTAMGDSVRVGQEEWECIMIRTGLKTPL